MITQEVLKRELEYHPDSGLFTRLVAAGQGGRFEAGSIAGGRDQSQGYVRIRVGGERHKAHRLAFLYMTGEFPPEQVDHVNHVRDDNRWCNLRLATNLENGKNQSLYPANTSGTSGVSWSRRERVWKVEITSDNVRMYLGRRTDKAEAIKLRKDAELKYGFHPNHGLERA